METQITGSQKSLQIGKVRISTQIENTGSQNWLQIKINNVETTDFWEQPFEKPILSILKNSWKRLTGKTISKLKFNV